MWLLDTTTLRLHEFFGDRVPPYAILSHAWSDDEVLFHEMQSISLEEIKDQPRYTKVLSFCVVAKAGGLGYGWLDSCCIDKRSSAELTEAINSMYQWYRDAKVCFIYLADVPPGMTEHDDRQRRAFASSKWFSRSWTLQELVASKERVFLAQDWTEIRNNLTATRDSVGDIEDFISEITGVDTKVLRDNSKLREKCIAERMSWASRRRATRSEDRVYSLMGIFEVNMAVLYGEGEEHAFKRLQEEIMKTSFDQSIFAWRGPYKSSGLLAHSPDDFKDTPQLGLWAPKYLEPYRMTNLGLQFRPQCLPKTVPGRVEAVIQCDIKVNDQWQLLLIHLRSVYQMRCTIDGVTCKAYRRVDCDKFSVHAEKRASQLGDRGTMLVLEDRQYNLVRDSQVSHYNRWGDKKN